MSNNDNQREQEVQQTAAGQAAQTNKGSVFLVNVLCLHDDNCFDRRAELIRIVEERSGGIYHIHPTVATFSFLLPCGVANPMEQYKSADVEVRTALYSANNNNEMEYTPQNN